MNAPTLSPLSVAPLHPVRRALVEAAIALNNLQPHRVRGEANDADCLALRTDVDDIRDIVMPALTALADYCRSETGADMRGELASIEENFRDAAFALEVKARRLTEWESEVAADPRGYAKAVAQGVD